MRYRRRRDVGIGGGRGGKGGVMVACLNTTFNGGKDGPKVTLEPWLSYHEMLPDGSVFLECVAIPGLATLKYCQTAEICLMECQACQASKL